MIPFHDKHAIIAAEAFFCPHEFLICLLPLMKKLDNEQVKNWNILL